jgi:hypothetical protein
MNRQRSKPDAIRVLLETQLTQSIKEPEQQTTANQREGPGEFLLKMKESQPTYKHLTCHS